LILAVARRDRKIARRSPVGPRASAFTIITRHGAGFGAGGDAGTGRASYSGSSER
jgi:hypothetical protein